MKVRKNLRQLSPTDRSRFVEAFVALKSQPSLLHPANPSYSRYDDFVETHLNAMDGTAWAHGDSAFFPWHRELMYQFEKLLQAVPGYSDVMIPYWDWTRDQRAGDPGFPFTHDFIGSDGDGTPSDRVQLDPAHAADAVYPYAFNPNAWPIVAKDNPGDASFLRRDFGSRADATQLPSNSAAIPGQVNSSYRQAIGVTNYGDLRARCEDIHNLVHRWVVGNMLDMTSPNDPVFWLHHCAIDRMWSIWQAKNPAAVKYTHTNGLAGHGLNDQMIFNHPGDPAPFLTAARPIDMLDAHAMHGDGHWYDSDLPEVTLLTPSVNFGSVPDGLRTFRALKFKVKTARSVRFRVVSVPTGNFSVPVEMPLPLGLEPDYVTDEFTVNFYTAFQWGGSTNLNSTIQIEAYIVDSESYFAATAGGDFSLGIFPVNLVATRQMRQPIAISMVLDRSGSMTAMAGGTDTRIGLLKGAVRVFADLMDPTDELGLINFDHEARTLQSMARRNSVTIDPLLASPEMDPRGATSVGGGIKRGKTLFSAATAGYQQAMIVLTDGNENYPPSIAQAQLDGDITTRTSAVGFGLPGQVSDMALHAITQNTHGDLIITGNLPDYEEQFLLKKYFIQILAGLNRDQVLLDPQGELVFGAEHRIPFQVSDAEIRLDVLVLNPLPKLVDVRLITPGGDVIDSSMTGPGTNILYSQTDDFCRYQVMLPALPASSTTSHGGKWEAVLKLQQAQNKKQFFRESAVEIRNFLQKHPHGYLPYNLIVQGFSNLFFAGNVLQTSMNPGAEVKIMASLREYEVPVTGRAKVVAEVVDPGGASVFLPLYETGGGNFETSFYTTVVGLYRLRMRAEGTTLGGQFFTREKALSVSAFIGGDQPGGSETGGLDLDKLIGWLRERDEECCHLLQCLFSKQVMTDKLRDQLMETGFDLDQLRRCLKMARRQTDAKAHLPSFNPLTARSEVSSKAASLSTEPAAAIWLDPDLGIDTQSEGRLVDLPQPRPIPPKPPHGKKPNHFPFVPLENHELPHQQPHGKKSKKK